MHFLVPWLQNGSAFKKLRHFICNYGPSFCFASNVPPPNVCPQGSVLWWDPQCWCLIFIPAPKHCHSSKNLGSLNASHFCFVFKICLYKAFQKGTDRIWKYEASGYWWCVHLVFFFSFFFWFCLAFRRLPQFFVHLISMRIFAVVTHWQVVHVCEI